MLPFEQIGEGSPALILMPFLSGSMHQWRQVIELLSPRYRCIAIDLPGFGAAAAIPGYTVEEMVDALTSTLLDIKPRLESFILVGHSMAGKVSTVLARQIADRKTELTGLVGLVLVAPSPAGPEPMSDEKRSEMLASLGEQHFDERARAAQFIEDNLAHTLAPEVFEMHVDDVLRMNRSAWKAWLQHGSREDWSQRVGVLDLPTLIVAGESDGALGPAAQMEATLPHFSNGQIIAVNANHLIPTERPDELATLIESFVTENALAGIPAPAA